MASGKRKIEQLEAEKAEEMEKLVIVSGTQSQKQEEVEQLQKEMAEKSKTIERVCSEYIVFLHKIAFR